MLPCVHLRESMTVRRSDRAGRTYPAFRRTRPLGSLPSANPQELPVLGVEICAARPGKLLAALGQLQPHVMLMHSQAIDPKRVRLGSPGDEFKRLVERPRCSSIRGNTESDRLDAGPCPRVMHARIDDRASKPATPVAVGDIHAPDARAVLLLLARFPHDPRHRHGSFRLVGIGDREDGAIGIREVCLNRCKLPESAVVGRCAKRRRLRGERCAPEGLKAPGIVACESSCAGHAA